MSVFFTNKLKTFLVGVVAVLMALPMYAGNNDRAGSSGASQLLLMPWARTGALAGSNLANVKGMEAMSYNVAGMAFTEGIDIGFGSILYGGTNSGTTVNSLNMAFRLGESSSTLGLNVMQVGYGKIETTTVELPEGGAGSFAPNFISIGLSYAKEFSNSIYGGFTIKLLNESVANVNATGFAFDAGIKQMFLCVSPSDS